MWKSDNPLIRAFRVLVGFGIVSLIALTALTIIFAFPEKTPATNATALAKSCEDYGPVSRRGFGPHWACTAEIRDDKTGETWTDVVDMSVLGPESVAKQERITWGYSGGRTGRSDNRVYRSPDGYSEGISLTITIIIGCAAIPLLLWYFSKAIVWGFSQDEQRKFWEKINGTPEEQAEKKQEEAAQRARRQASRQRDAELKEERRRAKQQR